MRHTGTWWPKGEPYRWPRNYPVERIQLIHGACTEKEVEVLKLMAHGYGRRRIASLLGVSESAVRQRRRSAKAKLEPYIEEAA